MGTHNNPSTMYACTTCTNDMSHGRGRTSITMFVSCDHDFILTASNFGDLTAFMAILATFSLRVGRNGYL